MEFLGRLRPVALLILRLALGAIFIYHGYPKLFSGAQTTQQIMQMFQHFGLPGYFVYVAGVLECAGGLLLVLGLFTPIAALLLAIEMLVAIWRVHLPQGPITEMKNYELPLLCFAASFLLASFGAGKISLDYPLFANRVRGSSRPRFPKERR